MLLWLTIMGLAGSTMTAMVLPRPPSSPNRLPEDQNLVDRIIFGGKSIHGYSQSTNVERPDTDDYRLLEIELQGADEMDSIHLQELIQAMLKNQRGDHLTVEESQLRPDVVPNSILGVRDVGQPFDKDKRVVLRNPEEFREPDEKLYYLKMRPKVHVNVRGRSGSFLQATSAEPSRVLEITRAFPDQTNFPNRKAGKPPKKYQKISKETDGKKTDQKLVNQAPIYGLEYLSTTENSMATSSELPKQIPAPPSGQPSHQAFTAQTTPVHRYTLRRTDVLPTYSVTE